MLSIYLTEICADIQEETHTKMSLAALSLVIRNCKPKYLSTLQSIGKC